MEEIGEDVRDECSKYGQVRHLFVDRASQGFVYVRFADVNGAIGARNVRPGGGGAARGTRGAASALRPLAFDSLDGACPERSPPNRASAASLPCRRSTGAGSPSG